MVGKLVRQPVLGENGVHLHFMVAGAAKHFDDPCSRRIGRVVPAQHFDDDLLAVLSAAEVMGADEKVGMQALVRWVTKRIIPDALDDDDVLLAGAFDYSGHPRRVATAASDPIHFDRVAPKRRAGVPLRNGDFIAVGHHHEPPAVPRDLDGAYRAVVLRNFS